MEQELMMLLNNARANMRQAGVSIAPGAPMDWKYWQARVEALEEALSIVQCYTRAA